ncbi:MAG: dihydroorotase, partial [Clostridiaceae bacterium]|nr:dihydroorotase [Clostridiaceae bacterium]
MSILIKNANIINAKGIEKNLDILIENQIIKEIKKNIKLEAERVIDAKGLYVLPGLVDAHCHLRDPGYEYKEDIISGSKSAAKGGFTSIACMPNTNPVVDNFAVVTYIVEKAKKEAFVNVYPIGAVTKGQKGEELAEMGIMKEAGIVAVSDDGMPVMKPSVMKKALIYANQFNLLVISHCEDLDLAEEGSMNEGFMSTKLGLRGIPSAAESVMVARDVLLSEYTGIPVHIAHVSTKSSVEIIRNAKKNGVKVTCETCPHYFTLTEEACEGYDTNAKMNPPLRTQEDVEAIIEGLKDG